MKIEVVAYRKEWVAQFTSERERLKAALPIVFLQIFHIGSTAVKRAAAEFSGNDIEKYGDFKAAFVEQLEEVAIKWRLQIKANNEDHQL